MPDSLLIKPQQERSKKSLERLLNASALQIATGNFESISVAEIARQANCSVGTFYGRFQNKAALFHVVQERVFDKALSYVDARIDKFTEQSTIPPAARTDLEAVNFAIEVAVDLYTEHRGIFRAIFLHTRSVQDPALLERVERFNAACMQASMRIFETTQHSNSLGLNDKWRNGLEIILVYLRESILFGDPIATGEAHQLPLMKKVAAAMFSAFLSRPEPT